MSYNDEPAQYCKRKAEVLRPLVQPVCPPLAAYRIDFPRYNLNRFLNILPRYFNSKEPIGMSLTGGLDIRMIMVCINQPPESLPCYTFGGMYRDSFDIDYLGNF